MYINKQNISNFSQCLDFVDTIDFSDEEKSFNMGTWGRQDSCGTTACLLGWMSYAPIASKKGLTQPFNFGPDLFDQERADMINQFITNLGIGDKEADHLFCDFACDEMYQLAPVINRAREFLGRAEFVYDIIKHLDLKSEYWIELVSYRVTSMGTGHHFLRPKEHLAYEIRSNLRIGSV